MASTGSTDRPTKLRMSDDGDGQHRGVLRSGNAYNFNGTSHYIDVGDIGQECRTIMFCIKASSTTESIIDLDGGTHTVTVSSGTITAGGFTSPTIYVDGSSNNTTIATDGYYHIAITTNTGFDVDNLDIGRVASNYFQGALGNVMIFDVALTDSQIKRSFWHPEDPVPPGVNVDNLVGWWKLDNNNTSVTHVIDYSPNMVSGVVNSATILKGYPRPFPQVAVSGYSDYYWFDGTDDNVSFSGITSDFSITGYFEMTIKFHMPSGNQTIFSSNVGGTNRFAVQRNGSSFHVGIYDGSGSTKGTTDFVDNKFYTLTLTINNKVITAYLDGVEMTSTSGSTNMTATPATRIGSASSGAEQFYEGVIVSVEQTGKHLWTNKGGWVDEIGSDDGTVNGSMAQFRLTNGLSTDKDPYSISLANVKGYGYYFGTESIETWDKDSLDITSNFGVGAWVKFDATGSQEMIVGKRNAYRLYKNSSDKIIFGIYQSSTENTATSTTTISADTWYYVVATYDGSDILIYIDGELDKTESSFGNLDVSAFNLTTGEVNGTDYLTGIIDEPKVYDAVPSADDILTNYRAGLSAHS